MLMDHICTVNISYSRQAGEHVAHPACPSPPVTGWVAITDENRETIALSLPPVTPGKLVTTIYH